MSWMPFPAAFAFALVALAAHAEVTVADAWVRGTVAGQRATGAFMTVTSTRDAALVGAASPVAKVVEIHEMKLEGALMQMRAIDRLPLPAGKPVELRPGGYHVMLMGLLQPVSAGEVVPLTLTVEEKGGARVSVDVRAKVRALGAADAAAKH